MPTASIIVLSILLISFVFFIGGWLKPDVIAILVLISLVLTGLVEPGQAFEGFSSFAVIAIAGLMVLGKGLEITGVVKWVARQLEKIIRTSYHRLLFVNTLFPGLLSGFVNIVAAASFFIPVILRLCKKMKESQAKILLPMACVALIGANLTLIGASHNLVVDSLLKESQNTGFGFFEFTAVGAVLLIVALIYIFLIGQHLLPGKKKTQDPEESPVTANLTETYALEERLFEVWISEAIGENGLPLKELEIEKHGLTLITVTRESETLFFKGPDFKVHAEDLLLIQGKEDAVKEFCETYDELTFLGIPKSQVRYPISTAELAEAVIPPRSPYIGKKVKDINFVEKYGMTAIAYYRDDKPHRTHVQDTILEKGDSLLLYGPRELMREFEPKKEMLIYYKPGEPEVSSKMKKLAPVAALILAAVILTAALNIMPIAVSAVAGAVLMILIGIINPKQAYEAIDWKTLVLIGGMYPLGLALNETGTADLIGNFLVNTLGDFGPIVVMAGLAVLTMALTQPMHNAAVAIIMTPIAIQIATMMGSDPKAFCVAVIVSCSATFIMPYGHPAPFMVQEPGEYTGKDYFKFGIGLNVLALVVILTIIPMLWPVA